MAFHTEHPWRVANPPQDVAFTLYTWPSAGITTRVGRWHDGTVIIPLSDIGRALAFNQNSINQWAIKAKQFKVYHARDSAKVGPFAGKPARCVSATNAKQVYEYAAAREPGAPTLDPEGRREVAAERNMPWLREATYDTEKVVDAVLYNVECARWLITPRSRRDHAERRTIPTLKIKALRPFSARPDELYIRIPEIAEALGMPLALAYSRFQAFDLIARSMGQWTVPEARRDQLYEKKRRLASLPVVQRQMNWCVGRSLGRPSRCWPIEYGQEVVDVLTNPRERGRSEDAASGSLVHPLAGGALTAEFRARAALAHSPVELPDRSLPASPENVAASPLAAQIDDALAEFGLLHS